MPFCLSHLVWFSKIAVITILQGPFTTKRRTAWNVRECEFESAREGLMRRAVKEWQYWWHLSMTHLVFQWPLTWLPIHYFSMFHNSTLQLCLSPDYLMTIHGFMDLILNTGSKYLSNGHLVDNSPIGCWLTLNRTFFLSLFSAF